jgi:hypothetical protein
VTDPRIERRARIRVDRAWRGDVGREVEVRFFGGPSGTDFIEGEKYLVYTRRMPMTGRYNADRRTRLLSDATEDLAYFERAERPASGARITGSVSFDDEDAPYPAAGYKVRLGNVDREWSAETDAKGTFTFANIPADRYGIRVDVPETVRVKGPTAVDIPDPRACAEPRFRFASEGSVELFVVEANGKPAVRTTLELIDADTLDSAAPQVVAARTSADGSIAWGRIKARHRYVIGLNVTRVPHPRRPQPILFYPGVTDVRAAHRFEIGPGERVQLDTLRLPQPPARLNVTGVVLRPDGTPIPAADVVLRSAARLTRGQAAGAPVKSNAVGRFTIAAIAGYRYYVEALLSVEGKNARAYAVSDEFVLTENTEPLRLSRTATSKLQTPK